MYRGHDSLIQLSQGRHHTYAKCAPHGSAPRAGVTPVAPNPNTFAKARGQQSSRAPWALAKQPPQLETQAALGGDAPRADAVGPATPTKAASAKAIAAPAASARSQAATRKGCAPVQSKAQLAAFFMPKPRQTQGSDASEAVEAATTAEPEKLEIEEAVSRHHPADLVEAVAAVAARRAIRLRLAGHLRWSAFLQERCGQFGGAAAANAYHP